MSAKARYRSCKACTSAAACHSSDGTALLQQITVCFVRRREVGLSCDPTRRNMRW